MNKWVLIGGGVVMSISGVFYVGPIPPEAVTGLSLIWVGLAMTGE